MQHAIYVTSMVVDDELLPANTPVPSSTLTIYRRSQHTAAC